MPTTLKRVRRFACVVEALPLEGVKGLDLLRDSVVEEKLRDLDKRLPNNYWAILHDCDVEDGARKRPHWHIVLEFLTKHTATGVVKQLADALLVDENRVSVRECRSLVASIRYLTHMDDPDKISYPQLDVITNAPEVFREAISRREDDLSIDDLLRIIDDSKDQVEIMKAIGLKNYQKYRGVIVDVLRVKKWPS